MKEQNLAYRKPQQYQRIHMPKNTWAGVVIGGASLAFGFAMVWWIWWMAILSGGAMLAAWVIYAFGSDKDYYVEVEEIMTIEQKRYANLNRTNENTLEDDEVDAVTISV
jgi:cytochrome o ubiquinol oxidase subunit 1